MSLPLLRTEGHRAGLQLLKAGDYHQAVEVFESTLAQCGPHVALLADLAGAFYLKGDMGHFAQTVERFEADFQSVRHLLSRESLVRTHVCLAKYAEELGHIAEAFEHIELALEGVVAGDALAVSVRGQKLRLLATYGREAELAELYRRCSMVSDQSTEARIECFHALLLAEARLFGLKQIWPRFLELAREPKLQAADLRLCAIDLLEIALELDDQSNQTLILDFLQKQIDEQSLDPYEKELINLVGKEQVSAEDMFRWSRALAPQAQMRLLALSAWHTKQDIVQKKLNLHIQSYDFRTRKILKRKWSKLLESQGQVRLILKIARKEVHCAEKVLDLASSPQSWIALEALCEGLYAPSDVLGRLSKTGDSLENLESLRLMLLRLNKKLSTLAGVDWVVKHRKTGLLVNEQVILEKA